MLTILHGDDIVASRNELNRIRAAAPDKEIRDINGKDIKEDELRQAVESLSLFGNTMLVVIENLFSGIGRKEKQITLLSGILKNASTSVDIVVWEPKELGKTALTQLGGATIRAFKTPPIIFEFLDAIRPNSTKNLLVIFEKTIETVAPELVLYMLGTRIRQLIQVKDGLTPGKMSPWQAMRLTNQVKSFTMDKLLIMHTRILNLEYAFKTGASPYTLPQLITQFIIDM